MTGARWLWPLVAPGRCRQLLAAALLLSALSGIVALVPAFVVYVIAAVIFDRIDIPLSVMQVVFLGIASVIARLGLLLLARNTAGSATEFLSQHIRALVAVKIGTLPMGVVAATPAGSFEAILLDDVEAIGQYVSGTLVDIVGAYAMLVAALAILFARDWRFASATLAFALAAGAFLRLRALRSAAEIEAERIAREAFAAAVFDAIRSLALRMTLPAAPDDLQSVRARAQQDRRASGLRLERAAARSAQRAAIATSFGALVTVVVLWLGGPAVALSAVVLFAAFALRTSGALAFVFCADTSSAPARESAQRIRTLLDRPRLVEGTTLPNGDATLRFSQVSFAYPAASGGRGDVLHDVDFVAEAGRVTAIVGPSGSGKTTLTRLAVRLWDVDRGSVTLGGIDLRALPLDALMQRIACVFQDVALLDDTIAANLKLGRPEASDEEMMHAAASAGAHEFISALPAGYQTLVGDRGFHLSRGERQRVQIARALIKDAPCVILDEPTASLDPATELEVQAALGPLFRGKTVLVVAHRLATIVGADRIVDLYHGGRIEAQGSHRELLAASPTYAALWADYRTSIDWLAPIEAAAG